MSKVEIKLDFDGLNELRKSAEMESVCRQKAEEIASAATGNFTVDMAEFKSRNVAKVVATDKKTIMQQNKTGQIYDAVGGMMQ